MAMTFRFFLAACSCSLAYGSDGLQLLQMHAEAFIARDSILSGPGDNASSREVNFPPSKHPHSKVPSRRLPPLFMQTQSCSGSSIAIRIARDLMELHGVTAWTLQDGHGTPMEITKPDKNPFFTEKLGMDKATEALVEAAEGQGTTLIMKDVQAAALPALFKANARGVHLERENLLDLITCKVRDCFPRVKGFGTAVDGKGGAGACFARRNSGKPSIAKLDTLQLGWLLGKEQRLQTVMMGKLETAGFKNVPKVTYERLTAFALGVHGLSTSVDEWATVVAAWGMHPDRELIREFLLPSVGSHVDSRQRDKIENYDEVKAALEHSEFARMLDE